MEKVFILIIKSLMDIEWNNLISEVESSKTARNKRDVQNHQSECACDCAC